MIVNFSSQKPPSTLYALGFLPQRNQKGFWYQDTSSRSNLENFQLSSENRRILNTTSGWNYTLTPIANFTLSPSTKKQIIGWIKTLNWEFPSSSIKTIFTNHIFNYVYSWNLPGLQPQAYALIYSEPDLSHIAYVFYDPSVAKSNLPIRMVLQAIIDGQQKKQQYCYLGGFKPEVKYGYYKRNMPGFEYLQNNSWQPYHS